MYDPRTLKKMLTLDEGDRTHVYMDNAEPPNPTVGIGHNLRNGIPPSVRLLLDLSQGNPMDPVFTWPATAIDALYDLDVAEAERVMDAVMPTWRDLDDVRQLVLADMAFNLGHRLDQFHDFLSALRRGEWDEAVVQMRDSAWYRQVGIRAQRLCAMMGTGEMTA